MSHPTLRLATQADLPSLIDIQRNRASPHPPQHLLERWVSDDQFWVACLVDQIIGWMSLEYNFFEEGFVGTLWVDRLHRRRGVGRDLMARARAMCSTERLWTSTNLSNYPMHELLRSLEWKLSGVLQHLDPGDPEVVYVHTGDRGVEDV